MDNKREIACKILDYWSTMEFLGQDSYENCTGANELIREFKKYKKYSEQKKAARKQLTIFALLDGETEPYSEIVRYAETCKMNTWGNLTFYIGKVQRQLCIESLAKLLGNTELKQAEKNLDDIALFSFQCDQKGAYIEHSLSLSPLIWSLSRVKGALKGRISEYLSENDYRTTVDELEQELFGVADPRPSISENEEVEEQMAKYPRFDINAITIAQINIIQRRIIDTYSKFLPEGAMKPVASMRFQLFRDDKAKEKYDDDNYMGLSHDFFSNDLKMVREHIKNGDDDFTQAMLSELIEYICAPNNEFGEWDRHDLVHPRNRNAFTGDLLSILNIRNAPLGKWPSRYMPALMQQVAINLALDNNIQRAMGKAGKIFSVNGPPGTGKTTLLKEIISGNVVEKARLLSQYKIPDDAFEGHLFKHGDKEDGKYSKFYPKWFSFRDDRIADYGVLVTSCNNTAVENITKELPLSVGIRSQLKAKTEGSSSDSAEMQEQLQEVAALFSTDAPPETIRIYTQDSKRSGQYPEIYFTGYAKKLLGTGDVDADAWGLIAAPLGKKKNINKFYYDVLHPIWQDFMKKNDNIESRYLRYEDARERFLTQLHVVERMRDELANCADSAQTAWIECQQYQQLRTTSENRTREINSSLQTLSVKLNNIEKAITGCQAEYEKTSAVVSEQSAQLCSLQECRNEAEEQATDFQRKALEVERSVSVLTKLFRPSKYQTAVSLAKTYTDKANNCMTSAKQTKFAIFQTEEALKASKSAQDEVGARLKGKQQTLYALKGQKEQMDSALRQLRKELDEKEKRANSSAKERDDRFAMFQSNAETDTGAVIDAKLISDILADDQERSTSAQLVNPWTTQRYNREREKLFYLALQMTKEFLLSSKCCRTNLCILGQYWGLRTEKDTDRIIFHEQDRKAMIGSLLQTLFLLTPVVSSTFASVGRLLKDVAEPGAIGTLIIDEAGQAQPQMAVGALYRARRAIIVGDPKQVEPVVTDELSLLKVAYSEKLYSRYKDKSLSVQNCADIINPFGTFFENGTEYPDWVGCPLLIHRRCISPMYNISNQIAYNGIMKQQTFPPTKEKTDSFLLRASQWINVTGNENGHGDHYVLDQGAEVCRLVNTAFERADSPNLYIIAPFNKVVHGIRSTLVEYARQNADSALAKKRASLSDWIYDNIGTVHKFQGKEADEVIFLLGCDMSQREKYAVTSFVNSNLVNVAVTRAKYRLYVIGDARVWQRNRYVSAVKTSMDTLALQTIAEIAVQDIQTEKRQKLLLEQSEKLPGAASFTFQSGTEPEGAPRIEIDSDTFITCLNCAGFLKQELSPEQVRQFGFSSREKFNNLPEAIRKNLTMGMKLYYLLEPVYQVANHLDASCCGILFCKAIELQIRNNFAKGLKQQLPEFTIRSNTKQELVPLKEASDADLMLGTIQHILKGNVPELAEHMKLIGEDDYSENWWKSFNGKLKEFTYKRNQCCHPQLFQWKDLKKLLAYGFEMDTDRSKRDPKIGGVFYESTVGKKMERV